MNPLSTRALIALAYGAGAVVILSPLLSRAFIDLWVVDLLSHLQFPALVFLLYVAMRSGRPLVLSTGVVGMAIFALTLSVSSTASTDGRDELRVSTFNAGPDATLEAMAELRQRLASMHADVLVLVEAGAGARAAAAQWPEMPFHHIPDPSDGIGVMVLSRHRIEKIAAPRYDGQPQVARVRVYAPHQPFNLSAVHPLPPLSNRMLKERNELLQGEAQWLLEQPDPGLLVGDFNATPWSGISHALQKAGLLRLTSLVPTWGAVASNPLSMLPIDQILGTSHWRLHSNVVGPAFGSDHRMVFSALDIAAPVPVQYAVASRLSPIVLLLAVLFAGLLVLCVVRSRRVRVDVAPGVQQPIG